MNLLEISFVDRVEHADSLPRVGERRRVDDELARLFPPNPDGWLQFEFLENSTSRSPRCFLTRTGEVNCTPSSRGSFGGYGIELDKALAVILGGREGQKISPSEMTKRLWQYVKRHDLGKKSE